MSKQIIKQVVVTLVSNDSEDYPEIQVTYNGKATKGFRLSPYGLVSNPKNGSLGVAFSSQGQEAVKYIIPVSTIDRLKGLAEGECALFNEVTGAFVLMNDAGGIEFFGSDKATFNMSEVVINSNLTVNGNIDTTGNVTAVGNIAATGTLTGSDLIVPGSPNYTAHKHAQGNDSDGDSEVDTDTAT